MMDQVRPGHKNTQSMRLVDQIHPRHPDPPKIISRCSLGPIKLEILKAYTKNNLVNSFIRPFKSPARAPILFNEKPDQSLRLCIDYQGLNNPTIKNKYPLYLIEESLD